MLKIFKPGVVVTDMMCHMPYKTACYGFVGLCFQNAKLWQTKGCHSMFAR